MPSKYTTGNSPIGRRIRNKNSPVSGFAQVEREIGRVQSVPSLVSRSRQLPNGTLHLPPRAQAGGGSALCTPWSPTLVNTSETEVPDYKLRLSPGTINGVINSAWNDLVDVTDPVGADDLNYIIATVTFTDKQVTSIDYSVSATIPSGNELNPVTLESLPSSIKIILGTLVGTASCMVWNTNISISGIEVFQETIANPAANTKPYKSWYSYQLNSSA